MLIAHVTDLHVLEEGASSRRGFPKARLAFLSNGRPVDHVNRKQRAVDALARVALARPDHVCITGDLTEEGTDEQFEVFAEILAGSGLDPSRVTLVPGNHDAYTHDDGLGRALDGPLRPYRDASALGGVLDLASFVVLPVSTAMSQCFIRAAGFVGDDARRKLERGLLHAEARGVPALVAMHHPPVRETRRPMDWFDALLDASAVARVLAPFADARVLHGHLHQHTDNALGGHAHARAHGARAVADHPSPVRFYRITDGRLADVVPVT